MNHIASPRAATAAGSSVASVRTTRITPSPPMPARRSHSRATCPADSSCRPLASGTSTKSFSVPCPFTKEYSITGQILSRLLVSPVGRGIRSLYGETSPPNVRDRPSTPSLLTRRARRRTHSQAATWSGHRTGAEPLGVQRAVVLVERLHRAVRQLVGLPCPAVETQGVPVAGDLSPARALVRAERHGATVRRGPRGGYRGRAVSYTHLRAHETD